MSKIPSPHFQMESSAIVSSISSLINLGIVYIWPMYQSLDKRIWFTILFFAFVFFHPKESCTLFKILIFLGGAPISICYFFCPSVHPSICRVPYPKNHTSSNHRLWYSCVKWWYLHAFFSFFWNFDFFRLLDPGKRTK